MKLLTATLAAVLATLASAAKLTVQVSSSASLPNPATLTASTHAVLLGPSGVRYDVPLRRDSTFIFSDLPESSYLLTIHARDHFFPPLRIDVGHAEGDAKQEIVHAWQTFRGNEWSNKGPHYGSGAGELTIQVRASAQKDFYQSRGGFNVLGFLKSPMILMGVVSMVLVLGMPYLLDNMDPETKAEFEEIQKKGPLTGSNGAVSKAQNFDLAGFLSGSSSAANNGQDSKKG